MIYLTPGFGDGVKAYCLSSSTISPPSSTLRIMDPIKQFLSTLNHSISLTPCNPPPPPALGPFWMSPYLDERGRSEVASHPPVNTARPYNTLTAYLILRIILRSSTLSLTPPRLQPAPSSRQMTSSWGSLMILAIGCTLAAFWKPNMNTPGVTTPISKAASDLRSEELWILSGQRKRSRSGCRIRV